MGYDVFILKRAEKDLEEILTYKAGFYAGTAGRFIDELENVLEFVSGNPYVYRTYAQDARYRRAVVEDYLLFYKVYENPRAVKIYRVLHGKRQIEKYL
ncbi:MAG: type II toxin-antitoxin system RelE/ParE family toxin [Oscillospiraceae bacterium]|nr:type II toxin-antitoxin system RelE/ParE family toxin [Oscillospiraceae bacterium]